MRPGTPPSAAKQPYCVGEKVPSESHWISFFQNEKRRKGLKDLREGLRIKRTARGPNVPRPMAFRLEGAMMCGPPAALGRDLAALGTN